MRASGDTQRFQKLGRQNTLEIKLDRVALSVRARRFTEHGLDRSGQFVYKLQVFRPDIETDLISAQRSFRDEPAQKPHELPGDRHISTKCFVCVGTRDNRDLVVNAIQFPFRELVKSLVIAYLPPFGILRFGRELREFVEF